MEENTTTAQEPNEAEEKPIDWQAKYEQMREHARDWEKKARANQIDADELEKLKAEQMTEQEKATARAEAAEKELEALKADKARAEAAKEIADKTGVPLELLLYCKDEDSMTEFAKDYTKETHVSAAPKKGGQRIVRGNEAPRTNGELFADFANQFFKQ